MNNVAIPLFITSNLGMLYSMFISDKHSITHNINQEDNTILKSNINYRKQLNYTQNKIQNYAEDKVKDSFDMLNINNYTSQHKTVPLFYVPNMKPLLLKNVNANGGHDKIKLNAHINNVITNVPFQAFHIDAQAHDYHTNSLSNDYTKASTELHPLIVNQPDIPKKVEQIIKEALNKINNLYKASNFENIMSKLYMKDKQSMQSDLSDHPIGVTNLNLSNSINVSKSKTESSNPVIADDVKNVNNGSDNLASLNQTSAGYSVLPEIATNKWKVGLINSTISTTFKLSSKNQFNEVNIKNSPDTTVSTQTLSSVPVSSGNYNAHEEIENILKDALEKIRKIRKRKGKTILNPSSLNVYSAPTEIIFQSFSKNQSNEVNLNNSLVPTVSIKKISSISVPPDNANADEEIENILNNALKKIRKIKDKSTLNISSSTVYSEPTEIILFPKNQSNKVNINNLPVTTVSIKTLPSVSEPPDNVNAGEEIENIFKNALEKIRKIKDKTTSSISSQNSYPEQTGTTLNTEKIININHLPVPTVSMQTLSNIYVPPGNVTASKQIVNEYADEEIENILMDALGKIRKIKDKAISIISSPNDYSAPTETTLNTENIIQKNEKITMNYVDVSSDKNLDTSTFSLLPATPNNIINEFATYSSTPKVRITTGEKFQVATNKLKEGLINSTMPTKLQLFSMNQSSEVNINNSPVTAVSIQTLSYISVPPGNVNADKEIDNFYISKVYSVPTETTFKKENIIIKNEKITMNYVDDSNNNLNGSKPSLPITPKNIINDFVPKDTMSDTEHSVMHIDVATNKEVATEKQKEELINSTIPTILQLFSKNQSNEVNNPPVTTDSIQTLSSNTLPPGNINVDEEMVGILLDVFEKIRKIKDKTTISFSSDDNNLNTATTPLDTTIAQDISNSITTKLFNTDDKFCKLNKKLTIDNPSNILNKSNNKTTLNATTTPNKSICSSYMVTYPIDCVRPKTWETTLKGETRDVVQLKRSG